MIRFRAKALDIIGVHGHRTWSVTDGDAQNVCVLMPF
jgi:hypothetical protein